MKIVTFFVVGILLCLCCSAVVCAAETRAVGTSVAPAERPAVVIPAGVDTGKVTPVVTMEPIPERQDVVIPAGVDIGKKNPVAASLPGYSNWDIYWTTSELIGPDAYSAAYDVAYTDKFAGSTTIAIKSAREAWILIPFTNTITHSGAHPMTKWAYIQFSTDVPYTSPLMYGTSVSVYDGPTFIKTVTLPIQEYNGYMYTYYVDLGAYHEYSRGMQMVFRMKNFDTITHYMFIAGAGEKAEW